MNRSFVWLALTAALATCATAMQAATPQPTQESPNAPASSAAANVPTHVGPIPGPIKGPQDIDNPYKNSPTAATDGRRLFVAMNCSGCHGGHAGGGMGPSLRDADWIYGHQPVDIYDSIAEGRANGMPSWGTLLPPESMWLLVSYIQTLRTDNEPDPPR